MSVLSDYSRERAVFLNPGRRLAIGDKFAILGFGHPNLAYVDTFKSKITQEGCSVARILLVEEHPQAMQGLGRCRFRGRVLEIRGGERQRLLHVIGFQLGEAAINGQPHSAYAWLSVHLVGFQVILSNRCITSIFV